MSVSRGRLGDGASCMKKGGGGRAWELCALGRRSVVFDTFYADCRGIYSRFRWYGDGL